MNAVEHRVRTRDGAAQRLLVADVEGYALDIRMFRPRSRAGQHPDLLTGLSQLLGDGAADRAGSGDDGQGAHVDSFPMGRAMLSKAVSMRLRSSHVKSGALFC